MTLLDQLALGKLKEILNKYYLWPNVDVQILTIRNVVKIKLHNTEIHVICYVILIDHLAVYVLEEMAILLVKYVQ